MRSTTRAVSTRRTSRACSVQFAEAQGGLGANRLAVTGVPKRSLLKLYFRRAAIDGMTDPWFLEIIVNPDVLEFERPFVIAHEWGHLAGYANEAEANFIAWMTCVHGDAGARYSGWLAAYEHTIGALPRADRTAVKALDPGPLEDLRAIAARYERSSPVVRQAARGVYEKYLKANRVAEGIASYDAVVRLMIGTRFDARWTPARRSRTGSCFSGLRFGVVVSSWSKSVRRHRRGNAAGAKVIRTVHPDSPAAGARPPTCAIRIDGTDRAACPSISDGLFR